MLELTIEKTKQKGISPYLELEHNLKPEVENALMVLSAEPLPPPDTQLTVEELEKEVLSLSELHYKAAKMKRRGQPYDKIATTLGLSVVTVKKMIERTLNLGTRLLPLHTEELRQEVLNQLDDFLSGIYTEASAGGRESLNIDEVDTALKILDRKIKLLGIEPPKEIKMTVSQEIVQAKTQLDKIMESYGVIDVTPVEHFTPNEDYKDVASDDSDMD